MIAYIGTLIGIWSIVVTINFDTISKYTNIQYDYLFKRVKDQYKDTLQIDVSASQFKVKHLFLVDLTPSTSRLLSEVRKSVIDSLAFYLTANETFTSENGGPESLYKIKEVEHDILLLALYEAVQLNDSVKLLLFEGYSNQPLVLDKIDITGNQLNKNWTRLTKPASIDARNAGSNFGEIYDNLTDEILAEHEGNDKMIVTIFSDFIPDDEIIDTEKSIKRLHNTLYEIEHNTQKNKFQFNYLFLTGSYKSQNNTKQNDAEKHKEILLNSIKSIAFSHDFDLTNLIDLETLNQINLTPIKYDPIQSNIILLGPTAKFRKEYYQNKNFKYSNISFSQQGNYSLNLPREFLGTLKIKHQNDIYSLSKENRSITLNIQGPSDILELSTEEQLEDFSKVFISCKATGYREAFVLDQSKRLSNSQLQFLLVTPYYALCLIIYLVSYLVISLLMIFLIKFFIPSWNIDLQWWVFFVPFTLASFLSIIVLTSLNQLQECKLTLGYFCGNNDLYLLSDFNILFILTLIFILIVEIYQYLRRDNITPDNGGGGALSLGSKVTSWRDK